MSITKRLIGLIFSVFALNSFAGDVTPERLANSEAEPGNWLNHHGNYEAHRYSALDQINTDNVKELKVAFTWAMGGYTRWW